MTTFRTLEDVVANWPLANDIANDPTRNDDDRITRADDGTFCTVGELRTAMTSASAEQLRAFERELRRRDSGFMAITKTDANTGVGTYEARTPAGQTAPKNFTFTDDVITTPTFAGHVNAGGPNKDKDVTGTFAPPNGYQKALAERRAAEQTPESTFEDRWKADRLRDLAAEPARVAALRAAHGIPEPRFVVLSADDLCKSPDIYGPGIKALQERDRRAAAAKEAK